jgi:DNA-binding transcriptional LysR family regulator
MKVMISVTSEQLLYAIELANHRTIQETASSLHISKSGLSQAISQLENELGVCLFTRSHRGTQLTAQGQEMLPYLKDMLDANLRMQNFATTLTGRHRTQTIRLAYANTLLKPMLTEYLALADEKHYLSIGQQSSRQIIERVRQHTLDAGFIAIDAEHENQLQGLDFQNIHNGHISLIVSPDSPLLRKKQIDLTDLQSQVFALFNDPYNDQLFEHLQYLCGPLKKIVRLDDSWAMGTVIKECGAVCLARDWQARHSPDRDFATLPKINLSHLINDRFKLGWVTNPRYPLPTFILQLIKQINQKLQ